MIQYCSCTSKHQERERESEREREREGGREGEREIEGERDRARSRLCSVPEPRASFFSSRRMSSGDERDVVDWYLVATKDARPEGRLASAVGSPRLVADPTLGGADARC